MIEVDDSISKRNGRWGHAQCNNDAPVQSAHELKVNRQLDAQADTVLANTFQPEVVSTPKPEREFIPSKYHTPIFEAVKLGASNLVLGATAGSGKTSTLKQIIFNLIPRDKSWIYIVFASRNRHEAQEKFSELFNGEVHTYHSFCLSMLKKTLPKFKVDSEGKKVYRVIATISNRSDEGELWPIVAKIVGLFQNTLTDPNNYDAVMEMCDHFGVELNGSGNRIIELARDTLALCRNNKTEISFDDMPYLVVVEDVPVTQYDYVLVDEVQDANKTNIKLIEQLQKPGGMTICVGDVNQAIMGFRGAENDAMEQIAKMLNALELPLSLSYRNPKSHVRLINETFPDIKHECLPDAPEGEILTIEGQDLQAVVRPGDMVICRTNAPLVKPAFDLIRHGIKTVIMGRAIGEELINLIDRNAKRVKSDSLETVLDEISKYCETEVSRLLCQQKESTAQALQDKVDTVFALADGCQTLAELIGKAKTIFSDDAKGVVFSSAHRAKGLEADSVFILRYDLMPHPMSKRSWQLKQEANIKFVALTRARQRLYFVKG